MTIVMINKENQKFTEEQLHKELQILKNNEVYRISDLMRFKIKHRVVDELMTNSEYEGTLMRQFFENCSKHRVNNKTSRLYETAKEFMIKNKIKVYGDNHILVHIRTGDDLSFRGLMNSKNFLFYLNMINRYRKFNKTVVLVTALHYGSNPKSKLYNVHKWKYSDESKNKNVQLLRKLISYIRLPVKICSNIDTDLDLIKLIFSKHVIACPNSGGFSKVVISLHNLFKNSKFVIPKENLIQ